MSQFKQIKKNSLWHSPLSLIFLLIVILWLLYSIFDLFEKERSTSEKKNQILNKIENQRERELKLTSDLNKLKTEEGIEETIRDKYQVVKEGEKMVIIVDDDNPTNENDTNKDLNIKTNILNNFFQKFKRN